MKQITNKGNWYRWEVTIEVQNYEPRSPGTFGGQLVLRIERPIVKARNVGEAERKALAQVTGFRTRVIGSKKKKCD